eukprot:1411066-Lingulodinium_polyedra.AAC.1
MAAGEFMRVAWLELVEEGFELQRPYALAGRLPVATITDSKGGYDHLQNPMPGASSDLRSAIDVAIVRDALKRPGMELRWVEGTQQLTDPLTKRNGEGDLLRSALRLGEHAIVEEAVTLQRRLEERGRRLAMRQGRALPSFQAAATCRGGAIFEFDPADPEAEEAEPGDDENFEPTGAMRLRR